MPTLAKKAAERSTLYAVREAFPSFLAGINFSPEDTESPDFVGTDRDGHFVGLELTNWLNEQQTRNIARHDKLREHILRILGHQITEHPANLSSAVIFPDWDVHISRNHHEQLREQFQSLVQQVDGELRARRDGHWKVLQAEERFDFEIYRPDLQAYPIIQKYFLSIWFREIDRSIPIYPDRAWVSVIPDGGLYDPNDARQALKHVIESKVAHYSRQSAKSRLALHSLSKLFLLVYADTQKFTSNTPFQDWHQLRKSPTAGLEEVARAAASELDQSPAVFDGIYLFYPINGSQWLAQIWPNFHQFALK